MGPVRRQVSRYAAVLRRDRTASEQQFWLAVRNRRLGRFKFRFQHSIWPYVADFVCLETMVIAELDGSQQGPEVDGAREAYLTGKGYAVLRFWNNEVLHDLSVVLESVLAACERRSVR